MPIKIFDPELQDYWEDSDGQLLLFNSIEDAKECARKEGYKESVIRFDLKYEEHVEIDKSGYDYPLKP